MPQSSDKGEQSPVTDSKDFDDHRRSIDKAYAGIAKKALRQVRNGARAIIQEEKDFLEHSDRIDPTLRELYVGSIEQTISIFESYLENAQSICEPLGAAARKYGPEYWESERYKELPNDEKSRSVYAHSAKASPTANSLLNQAMSAGVELCVGEGMPNFEGAFIDEMNAIFSQPIDVETYGELAAHIFIFYEELWHSAQYAVWNQGYVDDGVESADYTLRDSLLWAIASEAEAKVGAAFMLMETLEGEKDSDKEMLMKGLIDATGSYPQKIISMVYDIYDEYGLESIRNNPSLLAPAFEVVFQDEDGEFGVDYGSLYQREMEKLRVLYPEKYDRFLEDAEMKVTLEEFVNTFGHNFGEKGMLEGRYGSIEDLVGIMPEDSSLRKFLSEGLNIPDTLHSPKLEDSSSPDVSPNPLPIKPQF